MAAWGAGLAEVLFQLFWRQEEGIAKSDAFDRAAILHVLGEEGAATGATGGSDQQCVEELQAMLLVPLHGGGEVFNGWSNYGEQSNCILNDLRRN